MDGRTYGRTYVRTDGWTDGRKISPFYRTLSPTRAAAQKGKERKIKMKREKEREIKIKETKIERETKRESGGEEGKIFRCKLHLEEFWGTNERMDHRRRLTNQLPSLLPGPPFLNK